MNTKPFLFSGRVKNGYDSHVHWRATGGFSRRISLHHVHSQKDIYELKPIQENFTGQWLLGYGWDQNQFNESTFPTRAWLDEKFGETPVYFIRVDGHAAWLNTAALKLSDHWHKNIKSRAGGAILLGDDGYPTGIFIDLAMREVLQYIPDDDASMQSDLLAGQKAFHGAGFTHIRDLTCDEKQWQVATALEKKGELQLAVEQFFSADEPSSFNECVRLARQAKKETHDLLRPKGVKVYFDGALGSEGALLSRPYLSGSGAGLQLLEVSQLAEMMQICFQNNLEIAVHAIGDEAAHIVARVALDLKSQNILGQLHLEHAELLRPETIKIFSQLGVICHLQPCHWLSDKKWLNNKIGELARFAFRWQELESAGVKYYFGSDSPIEKTSMQNNLYAVWDAKQNNIALPREDFFRDVSLMTRAHSHPDFNWCLETYSQFELGELVKIMFRGHQIG